MAIPLRARALDTELNSGGRRNLTLSLLPHLFCHFCAVSSHYASCCVNWPTARQGSGAVSLSHLLQDGQVGGCCLTSPPAGCSLGLELAHCPGHWSPLAWAPAQDLQDTERPQKRVRTMFNLEQLEELEKVFAKQHNLVGKNRAQLAARLKLTENQVGTGTAVGPGLHLRTDTTLQKALGRGWGEDMAFLPLCQEAGGDRPNYWHTPCMNEKKRPI